MIFKHLCKSVYNDNQRIWLMTYCRFRYYIAVPYNALNRNIVYAFMEEEDMLAFKMKFGI